MFFFNENMDSVCTPNNTALTHFYQTRDIHQPNKIGLDKTFHTSR